jgi:purine-nucleoside phosphorylase
MVTMMQAAFVRVDETVRAIRARVKDAAPKVGVVLGSGLGAFADALPGLVKVPYAELPHLPASKVAGHSGNLCFGTIGAVPVVCMQGRVHLYEGHPVAAVVHGVRTMVRLGASCILLTNAAGGLEPTWRAGDLMVVTDHINMTGHTPLAGPNDDALGPRFPDMSRAYDPRLVEHLEDVAREAKIELRKGIYAGLLGPSYETPAEVRMLRTFGAHAVGMSTVLEVIALRHIGARVGALSCVTNLAAGLGQGELAHAEVEETARARREAVLTLLGGWALRAATETP